MFNKDNKYKLNTSKPEKKAKKEKSPKEKSEGGKLFGGRSFGKESGGKLSGASKKERKGISFDFLKRKEKEGKISNDFSKGGGKLSEGGSKGSLKERFAWVKWWHIVIAAVVLVAIIVGIVLAVTLGGNNTPGGSNGGDEERLPEPEGTITSVGAFKSQDTDEYILCVYTEYFSKKTVVVAQKESDMQFGYDGYFVFINAEGKPLYNYSGKYNPAYTPEQIKNDMIDFMSGAAGYTPEIIAKCDVHVYQPVSFTKVKLSSVTLTSDNKVTVKYQAGAVDGELSAEYTLNGTYTKNENNFTFAYTNLPEDAALRHVAENVLKSAKYDYYDAYGSWMNTLTFGDKLTLGFTTDVE